MNRLASNIYNDSDHSSEEVEENTEEEVTMEATGEDDEEGEVTTLVDHLDLSEVISKLKQLTHLSVQYRVRNVGLDFDWSQFQFTGRDCVSFSKSIRAHTSLRILELVK